MKGSFDFAAIGAKRDRSRATLPMSRSAAGSDSSSAELLAARRVVKSYRKGKHDIQVLLGVDFAVKEGEFVSVVGQSGSGKSTLLHVLGMLDLPDDGEVYYQGQRIDNRPAVDRDRYRNRSVGMVFQFYHLLPELTALENVLMPLMISERPFTYRRHKRVYTERAEMLMAQVGLTHRMQHKPRELSGGEMQRAAIARALIAQPQLLLADEPTGNLDRQNGEEIMAILRSLNAEQNLTIVMVTHDNAIACQADRVVRLAEGCVRSVAA